MIITVAYEAGSKALHLADVIAKEFDLTVLDSEAIIQRFIAPLTNPKQLKQLHLSSKVWLSKTESGITFSELRRKALAQAAQTESLLLLDNSAALTLINNPHCIHLKVVTPRNIRRLNIEVQRRQLSLDPTVKNELSQLLSGENQTTICTHDSEEILQRIERSQRRHNLVLFGRDAGQDDYAAIFNLEQVGLACCCSMIKSLVSEYRTKLNISKPKYGDQEPQLQMRSVPEFKNDDEREFAEILDLYHIDWRYEPRFFPVEWDENERVTLAFAPDFYLPKFNLYLELTTMNQKYVSLKNKKLRLLRELYPGVNVKIIYKKDFESLLARFE